MAITLDQIKSLRDRTGVSTTACKKALEEANGDENLALDVLRKKGEAKIAERSDRDTANGVVATASSNGKIAILAIGCETDFVAKNEDFVKKIEALAGKLLQEGESTDLSNELSDLNIQMGEKIEIKGQRVLEGATVGSYIHLNGRIGVAIALDGSDAETANDIAMHIAAMNPLTISPDEVDEALLTKEKEIWTDQLKSEGKPENIMAQIMIGKEKKFREENALISQPFVKNPETSIGGLLSGSNVISFVRYSV